MNSHLKIFAVVGAMALLIPAAAIAKRPDDKPVKAHKHGSVEKGGKGKNLKLKFATVNVKGLVESNDGTTMTVAVGKASGHAKACKGTTLTFDVSTARFHTADNDTDGDMDAADVLVGHAVKVRAKVLKSKGRKTVCTIGDGPAIPAKAVHNRTTPQVDEDVEETDEVDEDETDVDELEGVDETDDLEDEADDLDEDGTDLDETDVDETDEF